MTVKPASSEEEQAVCTMQKYYRGIITRREVKSKYGFEAKQMDRNANPGQTYTQSDAQVMEARRLVMQIRQSLEAFNYEPAPSDYPQ